MRRIGRYEIVRELGRGGMGAVFVGRDPELQRAVAIKLLHHDDHAQRAMFRDEARALAALNHPNIVTIYEVGEHDGQRYLAMEYVEGRTLRELLEGRLPRARVLEIVAEVVRAIAAAHKAGILHRDIKPENVLVGEVVKVVDFGIARRLDAEDPTQLRDASAAQSLVDMFTQTVRVDAAVPTLRAGEPAGTVTQPTEAAPSTKTVFGTPAYMAPEVLVGKPSSEASDVYSLGVLLYECLAGRRPHETPRLHELIARVIDGEPVARLADPLWPLVERMLAFEPAGRPTLDELARALAPPTADHPRVAVAHPRAWGRWAIAGVLVLAAAGAGVAWRLRGSTADERRPTGLVAVDTLRSDFRSLGEGGADLYVVGDLLARELGALEIPAVSPLQFDVVGSANLEYAGGTNGLARAQEVGAKWLVRGKVLEGPGGLVGVLELVDVASQRPISIVRREPRRRPAVLVHELARAVAAVLAPEARLLPGARARALALLEAGHTRLDAAYWMGAQLYFEQAVHTDPTLPEAWSALASARAWTVAPQAATDEAIAKTIELATDSQTRELWIGVRWYYQYRFDRAVAALRPLVEGAKLPRRLHRDAVYFLGEALYHDGAHDEGIRYLRHVVDHMGGYKPAATHVAEYALVRGDFETSARYHPLERGSARVDFARGRYDELAGTRDLPFNLYAQILLGRSPDPALIAPGSRHGRLYRYASAPDPAAARAAFEALWVDLTARSPTSAWTDLFETFEIALAAERRDDVRRLIEYLRPHTADFRGYHRLEVFAAPLLGGPPAFARDELNGREAQDAAAIEAELAGDRATAARLLEALVRNPSTYWDYPERAALLRNLAALGRWKEVEALCAGMRRPAVFRYAWLPIHRTCTARFGDTPAK